MASLETSRIVVAGAGVFGLSIAVLLAQAGARVVLADPRPLGDSASGVAAGMLAPAFEAVLDAPMGGGFSLLRDARDLWPDFASRLGGADMGLHRSGAIWVEVDADRTGRLDALYGNLNAMDAQAERLSADDARAAFPDLARVVGGVRTADDWRLSPRRALAALLRAAIEAGVDTTAQELAGFDRGVARLSDGRAIPADAIILATGAAPSHLAPETGLLIPIKGHILTTPNPGPANAPVLRCEGGYLVANTDVLHIGATMEAGRDDAVIDPDAVTNLWAMALRLYPALAAATPDARTGVRAATPDGWPLVGPSSQPGVYLAVGARRNGWLLAPLVARMMAAYLADRDPGSTASLFDASRFSRVD